MRIVSWNVNGIRAMARKGFFEWLEQTRPDVLCLQETKADPASLGDEILVPLGYQSYWAVAERKGYSGVATFCREAPVNCQIGLGIPRFDAEGRVVITDFGSFELYNAYFPNSGMGPERVAYKLDFFEAFLSRINERVQSGKPVIFCGDVNAAHKEIDIARPKENVKTAGFLPEERAWMDRYIENGWVDTFRHFYPEARDVYTWWDQRFNARVRNIGWRIDYFFIHQQHLDAVKATGVTPDVMGSDHCPIWIEIDESQLGS
jgi:exodeoxyribonuclease III